MRSVKEDIKKKEEKLKTTIEEWQKVMLKIPNIPSVDTPEGPDESGNKVIRSWGKNHNFFYSERAL